MPLALGGGMHVVTPQIFPGVDEQTLGATHETYGNLNQMDVLSLSCTPAWGAPDDGTLFTDEAFSRYSVAAAKEGATPSPHTYLPTGSGHHLLEADHESRGAKCRRKNAVSVGDGSDGEGSRTEAVSGLTSPGGRPYEVSAVSNPHPPSQLPSSGMPAGQAQAKQRPTQSIQHLQESTAAFLPSKATHETPVSIFQPHRRHATRANILPTRLTAGPLRQVDLPPPKKRGRPRKQPTHATTPDHPQGSTGRNLAAGNQGSDSSRNRSTRQGAAHRQEAAGSAHQADTTR